MFVYKFRLSFPSLEVCATSTSQSERRPQNKGRDWEHKTDFTKSVHLVFIIETNMLWGPAILRALFEINTNSSPNLRREMRAGDRNIHDHVKMNKNLPIRQLS